jgi:hypothetical protein
MLAPRVIKLASTHGIAVWHNVVVTDIQGDVDAADVRGIVGAYDKLLETHPAGIVGITVLRASLKVGTRETHAEAKRAMERLRTKIIHVAIVIENQGLLAPLLRTIIRTLNSIARSSRLSIATDLEAATRAVAPHAIGTDVGSTQQVQRDLLEVIATVRRALPAARP